MPFQSGEVAKRAVDDGSDQRPVGKRQGSIDGIAVFAIEHPIQRSLLFQNGGQNAGGGNARSETRLVLEDEGPSSRPLPFAGLGFLDRAGLF